MSSSSLKLVVGLGNPGKQYDMTRHNAGFIAVDELAKSHSISLDKRKFDSIFGKGKIKGREVILAKPQAYMNRSGPPVRRLADFFRIQCMDMVVLHDDIDLAFGRIKIKEKGGDGGHKGIRSIKQAFGEDAFTRIRIGVGRSEASAEVVGHVLGRFNQEETDKLNEIIAVVEDAAVTILCNGALEGMNRFNCIKTIFQ